MATLPKGWRLVTGFALAMGLVFLVLGGITRGFSLRLSMFHFGLGIFLGAIGAPELEPKLFRSPVLWQVSFAVVGCVMFAASVSAPLEGYALAISVGAILGYLAPYWIRHVQGP